MRPKLKADGSRTSKKARELTEAKGASKKKPGARKGEKHKEVPLVSAGGGGPEEGKKYNVGGVLDEK